MKKVVIKTTLSNCLTLRTLEQANRPNARVASFLKVMIMVVRDHLWETVADQMVRMELWLIYHRLPRVNSISMS